MIGVCAVSRLVCAFDDYLQKVSVRGGVKFVSDVKHIYGVCNDVAVFVKGVVGDVIEGVSSAGIVAEIVGQFGFLSDIIPRFIRVHAHCLDACHAESAVVIVFEIFDIHLCVLFKNFFARTGLREEVSVVEPRYGCVNISGEILRSSESAQTAIGKFLIGKPSVVVSRRSVLSAFVIVGIAARNKTEAGGNGDYKTNRDCKYFFIAFTSLNIFGDVACLIYTTSLCVYNDKALMLAMQEKNAPI